MPVMRLLLAAVATTWCACAPTGVECPDDAQQRKVKRREGTSIGCALANGTLHGPSRTEDEHGNITEVGNYHRGKPRGFLLKWGRDRRLSAAAHFPRGRKSPAWEITWSDGRLARLTAIDAEDTQTILRFHKGGSLAVLASARDGRSHGPERHWNESGTLILSGEHRDGEKDGTWKVVSPSGQLLAEEQYSRGEPTGTWKKWDDSGRLLWQSRFEDGRAVETQAYWSRPADSEGSAELDQLQALGYVGSTELPTGGEGVTIHQRKQVHAGCSVYSSGYGPAAFLIDMDGVVLHQWKYRIPEEWLELPWVHRAGNDVDHWRRMHLLPGGDLLAILEGIGLFKLDRNSKILWALPNGAHHDLDLLEDGSLVVLTREARFAELDGKRTPVIEEMVSFLNSDGEERKRASLSKIIASSELGELMAGKQGDILHINSVDVVETTHPLFKPGQLLLSLRHLNALAVVDLDAGQVVWSKTGQWRRQHEARLLPNGNILFFDNRFRDGDESRAVELDPRTGEEVWTYAEGKSFHSTTLGATQRLPNGNVLVTDSHAARAFEVTRGGEKVWEYKTHQLGANKKPAKIIVMNRLPDGFDIAWAQGAKEGVSSATLCRGTVDR